MITLTADKVYYSPFTLKKIKHDSEAVTEFDRHDLIYMLSEEVELGDDVTFKNLFDIIIFHKEFFNILYSKEMRGLLIDDFINDYESDFDLSIDNEGFDLMIAWNCDTFQCDNEVEYIDFVSFQGFGKLNAQDDLDDYPIGMAFTPLSEIKDKRVFLNNAFELHDDNSIESDIDAVFKATYRKFTLYDVFGSILHEIAFYGDPAQRELEKKKMQNLEIEFENFIQSSLDENGEIMWTDEDEDGYIGEEFDGFINKSFWDTLYPRKVGDANKTVGAIDSAIIAISEGSGLTLEEQLKKAHDSEDFEKAGKLLNLIHKRDGKLK